MLTLSLISELLLSVTTDKSGRLLSPQLDKWKLTVAWIFYNADQSTTDHVGATEDSAGTQPTVVFMDHVGSKLKNGPYMG